MSRTRWFVVGFLLIVAVVGGFLNERGTGYMERGCLKPTVLR